MPLLERIKLFGVGSLVGTLNNTRLEFEISRVEDPILKDILQSIRDFIRDFPFFNADWKFFEFRFSKGEDNKKIPHGFKFTPTDVLQTAIIGEAAIIWNYDLFDETNLDVTISSACTVRAFIGRVTA